MDEINQENKSIDPFNDSTCPATVCQCADLNVTVALQPNTKVGKIKTHCCGNPVVDCSVHKNCGDKNRCMITVMQTVCIKIPIEFGITANIEENTITCKQICPFYNKKSCSI